ncbi:mRNA capping enzyme, alpha subunit [Teratosphaeria nubilosa]|uniref:mRNA-capping enzyme subunit alpha n=1 Tax=Teratosphaeria nubilosa TaxID=161662 RepID=A0A6G1KWX1_9PEZI|nr:mRNA capping enzyme, alpha subunit [Teratosphaeria nubilosa]
MGSSIDLAQVGERLTHEDREFEQKNVADLLHRHQLSFPGAQPVSFARHHIEELVNRDYFVCEKTDGIRCLLFLTFNMVNGQPAEFQLLIDRKNDYYVVPLDKMHVPKGSPSGPGFELGNFHKRTLLDGELVVDIDKQGRRKLVYYVFDMLALDGTSIMDMPLDRRYGRAGELVVKPYERFMAHPDFKENMEHQAPFFIKLKKMEAPYGTQMMFKDILPNLPHGNDGLIFTCVSTPYVSGTDRHILKWKPPHENTVDFRLIIEAFPKEEYEDGIHEDWDAKPEIHLEVNHAEGGYQYFASLALTDAEWENIKRKGEQIDGRIIECYRDPISAHWRPKIEPDGCPRFRDDKKDANHISVVNSVIESIKDAVSERDLVEAAGRIKVAYKARQARKTAEAEERRRRDLAMRQQQQQHPLRQEQQRVADEDGPHYEE